MATTMLWGPYTYFPKPWGLPPGQGYTVWYGPDTRIDRAVITVTAYPSPNGMNARNALTMTSTTRSTTLREGSPYHYDSVFEVSLTNTGTEYVRSFDAYVYLVKP